MLTFLNNLNIDLPLWLMVAAGFLFAFCLTYLAIPTIVRISEYKNLLDIPEKRKSHETAIPVIGGIPIFIGLSLASILFSLPGELKFVCYLLGGMIILMFLGLKDDILIIDAKKKLIGQFIASIIVVVVGDIRISDFHNVFGIGEIPYLISITFSVLLLTFIIICFNFIDGVDGLASGIAIIASVFYGIWFILTENYTYANIAFSLTGSMIAFFRFNVFGRKNKIFLGDAGALIIGLVICVLTIQFIELGKFAPLKFQFFSTPSIAIALLFIPIFDAIRILIIRIGDGAIFKSGKNHIHHIILSRGNSHIFTSITLISGNIFILIIVLVFQKAGNNILIGLMGLFSVILLIFLRYFSKKV